MANLILSNPQVALMAVKDENKTAFDRHALRAAKRTTMETTGDKAVIGGNVCSRTQRQGVSLEVRGIRKSYNGHEVLKGIDFEVNPGEIFVIMGPRGCGKTVLLRQLIGLETPDQGEILVEGQPIQSPEVTTGYCNSTGTNAAPALKISKNPLGKESVGDQACDKSQWKVTESSGEYHDITVWTSMNVSNLPIQIKVGAPPVWVIFQNLHLEAPASSLFEVPAGYIKYEGIQENILRDAEKRQITNSP